MNGFTNRLLGLDRKGRISGGEGVSRETDLPLDHQLTFCPQRDERWAFRDDRVYLNDTDVREVISEHPNDAGVLSGLSQGLSDYQQHVWSRGGKGMARFNGTVASLQDTCLGRLGTIYDGLTAGVHFECVGDDFWINNVNVRQVLDLYRQHPTDKTRRYLFSIQQKLDLILSRQHSSTRYDGVHARARQLFLEVSSALEYLPADAPPCLGVGGGSA
jgi:hypothetical protein